MAYNYNYKRGDRVEILNKEDGFEGSFYLANIISQISTTEFIVQYKTLVNNNGSGPLREILSTDKIRPKPPEILVPRFSPEDEVDAYENDGWWVGKIVEEKEEKYYLVHFETSDELIEYPLDMLRVHQEWKDGVWVYCKK